MDLENYLFPKDIKKLKQLENKLQLSLPSTLFLIGVDSQELLNLFTEFINKTFEPDKTLSFNEKNTSLKVIDDLIFVKNSKILIITNLHDNLLNTKLIYKLSLLRDALSKNLNSLVILTNASTYKSIFKDFADLIAGRTFDHLFFSKRIPIETNLLINEEYEKIIQDLNFINLQKIKKYNLIIVLRKLRRHGFIKQTKEIILDILQLIKKHHLQLNWTDLKFELYLELIKLLLYSGKPLKVETYYKKIKKIKSLNTKNIAHTQMYVIKALNQQGKLEQAQELLEKVLTELENIEFPRVKSQIYAEYGYLNIYKTYLQQAECWFIKRNEYNKIKIDRWVIYSLTDLGNLYGFKGEIEKAKNYYISAEKLAVNLKFFRPLPEIYTRLGKVYFNKLHIGKAFHYHVKALKWAKNNIDNIYFIKNYIDLGRIAFYQGDINYAIKLLKNALNLASLNAFYSAYSRASFYLAFIILTTKTDFSSAFNYLKNIEHINIFTNRIKSIIRYDFIKSLYFYRSGDYKTALKLINSAEENARKINFIEQLVRIIIAKAHISIKLQKYSETEELLNEAYHISKKYNFLEGIIFSTISKVQIKIDQNNFSLNDLTILNKYEEKAENYSFYIILPKIYNLKILIYKKFDKHTQAEYTQKKLYELYKYFKVQHLYHYFD